MQLLPKWLALMMIATVLSAQTTSPAAKTPAVKTYCHPVDDFCFQYPPGWQVLGEVFEGNGIVVAPPQKQGRELWDSVTVARIIPPPQNKDDAITIGEAIAQAESGVRESGQNFETLERRQRTVGGNPAEVVKLRYTENSTSRNWIEYLVFIEGPSSEIYSVSLKTSPAGLAAMEPQFSRIVESWRLADRSGTNSTNPSVPGQRTDSNPKAPAPPKP
jgi:hypothetical protein